MPTLTPKPSTCCYCGVGCGVLVCSCNNVGADNLRQAIATSCTSLPVLCATTGAGTGCGSCRPEVQRLLEASLVEA